MDSQFHDLLARLDHLSGQFDDLRGLIRKAVRLADDDPEMALTRVRKVLEYVVHDAYQRLVKAPPGTQPLEVLLQRLVKDGHLPVHLSPRTTFIRELGNAGTHHAEGNLQALDVNVALIQLKAVLDWYFQAVRPEAAAPAVSPNPPPGPVEPPRPAGVGSPVGSPPGRPATSKAAPPHSPAPSVSPNPPPGPVEPPRPAGVGSPVGSPPGRPAASKAAPSPTPAPPLSSGPPSASGARAAVGGGWLPGRSAASSVGRKQGGAFSPPGYKAGGFPRVVAPTR